MASKFHIIPVICSILKAILEKLIDDLENASPEELKSYDEACRKIEAKVDSILKSDLFKGIVVTLSGAAGLVGTANIGLVAAGFTTTGVQAASIAASWMSLYGNEIFKL